MDETVKLTIDFIETMLKDSIRESGEWLKESQKLAKSNDDKYLRDNVFALQFLWEKQHVAGTNIIKRLLGSNVFTPSLSSRGWQLWKQPAVNSQQKKKLEDAVLRWSQDEETEMEKLTRQYKPSGDPHNTITYLSSCMEIASTYNRRFITDLKSIMSN